MERRLIWDANVIEIAKDDDTDETLLWHHIHAMIDVSYYETTPVRYCHVFARLSPSRSRREILEGKAAVCKSFTSLQSYYSRRPTNWKVAYGQKIYRYSSYEHKWVSASNARLFQLLLRILPKLWHALFLAPAPDLAVEVWYHDKPHDGHNPSHQCVHHDIVPLTTTKRAPTQ